jgi:UDP-N-acetylmuramoyl-L-alanyl-D-glutamate--2,6-diaminopimelate ligase
MTQNAKSLAELGLTALAGADASVTGLAIDSRKVRPGTLFAALPGTQVHGARFVAGAIEDGAVAILTDRAGAEIAADALSGSNVALIVAEDARATLAHAAALWFGPGPETVVAVTGTNGKTSVASFTRQIWERLGHRAVNIGTTGVEGSYCAPGIHTTPDPLTLQALLADIRADGIDRVAMEASSHGLDQRRMEAVSPCAAAFTNLTQDHLDYHGTMEAYFDAKLRLFTELLPEDGVAVVNLDDPYGQRVAEIVEARGNEVVGVAQYTGAAELKITGRRLDERGPGRAGRGLGQADPRAPAADRGVPGDERDDGCGARHRLRRRTGRGFRRVARAHRRARAHAAGGRARQRRAGLCRLRPYARRAGTALKALRPHVLGRLHVVFGAGGDRDRGKRPLMGQAAAAEADVLIVTDDNPRSEDPAAIRAAVLAGCPEATEVGDRAEAILRAVDGLEAGDALLIAGKGHETGQQVGDVVYPFDDVEQASVAVAALEGRA